MLTMTSFMRRIVGATLAVMGLWQGSALAAPAPPPPPVPMTLQQQGRILDKDGAPVSSAVHFVFTVYDDPALSKAANVLWTEEQDITLDDGYFSTELGSVTAIPADLFDGSARYLGVTVGNDDEMAPRQTISSVPYALLAGTAATALSVPFTSISGVPAACADGKYLKGFGADGAAVCGTLPAMACHDTVGTQVAGGTSAFVGCAAGEVATGGGCYTNGALQTSSFYHCFVKVGFCACLVGQPCPGSGDWMCTTGAAANITPTVRCCTVQ